MNIKTTVDLPPKKMNPWLKFALEIGPLIVFFVTNSRAGLFWGTGVFQEGAGLVMEFAFETIGVHRLEALWLEVTTSDVGLVGHDEASSTDRVQQTDRLDGTVNDLQFVERASRRRDRPTRDRLDQHTVSVEELNHLKH